MIFRSLPLRVLAVVFIVLALPLLIDSFIFSKRLYNESIKDTKESLRQTGNYRAYAISELDPVRFVAIQELTVLLDIENGMPSIEELNQKLKKTKEIGPDFYISILGKEENGNYKILASSDESLVGSLFESSFLLGRALNKQKIGDFIRFQKKAGSSVEVPFISIAKKILSPTTKETVGVLVISTPIHQEILPMLEGGSERGLDINFAIMTRDEIVIAATDFTLLGNYLSSLSGEKKAQLVSSKQLGTLTLAEDPLAIVSKEETSFFEFIFANHVQIAYKVAIPNIDLFFLSYTSKKILFSHSVKHFLFIYATYGLIFIVGGAIAYWLSTWIARPLMQLCSLMTKVGKGDLSGRFKEEPLGFEINSLGNIFNQTLGALIENIQQAEDERVQKETFRKEMELGQEVQRNLLPREMPTVPGLEFEAVYLSPTEVGGDFYDIFLKNKTHIALTVADASGKGISACLYALSFRSLLRTSLTLHEGAGEILSHTNNMFIQDAGDTGMFVMAMMGIYDIEKRELSYYSCGHVPGIIRRANGQLAILNHSGMAIGLKESTPFKADKAQLYPGDILLLYTDGLIDVVNEKFQHFSEKRLRNFLQQKRIESAHDVVSGLTEEVKRFIGGVQQEEEIAILCMKVK